MINALIFDFGGTLDTHGDHWSKVMWKAYLHLGILNVSQEEDFRQAYVFVERTLGNGYIIRSNYTFKLTLDVKLRLQLEYMVTHGILDIKDKKDFQDIHQQLHLYLYEEVQCKVRESGEVLAPIAEQYPMALVTNFYGNMQMVLREMHLQQLFQYVVESAVVGIRKPDPAIFRQAIDRLGVDPKEVLVVGDSMKNDIIPAKQCGCCTCWLKGAGWENVTNTVSDHTVSDYTITDIHQLGSVILY